MIFKGNHVKFACFVLLAVSEEAKKQNKDSQNTKRFTKVANERFADYVKEKKLRECEVFSHD